MIRFVFTIICAMFCLTVKAHAANGPHILIDIKSGRVIDANRATDPWYPASVTKLMTLYVAANAIKEGRFGLQSTLTMSNYAARTAPSKMGFKTGTKVTLENAFKMLIVKSANDIAVGIAEHVSGSEQAFADEMNRTARRLGMTDTHFRNPHGLPNRNQITTARDMALLGRAIHREFPELLPIFNISAIRHGRRTLRSHNLLLEHYRGGSGMKTGFTCSSGLNMVATAERGGREYLAVVFGEASSIDRAEKAALLLETGFQGNRRRSLGELASYSPAATRSTPVDMRPIACGRSQKIRAFQIVEPQPKPKRGLFRRGNHESPQRKEFFPGLGDKSHPQGALVRSPSRSYRSHILQPRRERTVVAVHTGAAQSDAPQVFDIASEGGHRSQSRETETAQLIPFPTPNPTTQTTAAASIAGLAAASAFASPIRSRIADEGSGDETIDQRTLNRARAANALSRDPRLIREERGEPIALVPVTVVTKAGKPLPRVNPIR